MKGIKTYKENSVNVSSNEELVLRLFEIEVEFGTCAHREVFRRNPIQALTSEFVFEEIKRLCPFGRNVSLKDRRGKMGGHVTVFKCVADMTSALILIR